ncbi:MAG: class IV adenylate cyclase [Chitinophagales bacterium]
MVHLNIEIKARCNDPGFIKEYLKKNLAVFKGLDNQTDTYFKVPNGRLKLREGTIENNLIYYERENKPGTKESYFQLVKVQDAKALKEVLTRSLGIQIIVEKKREIWFIKNVKFHIDEVTGLGNFTEIEASDLFEDVSKEELQKQCDFFLKELDIKNEDLAPVSYSDMLLAEPKKL